MHEMFGPDAALIAALAAVVRPVDGPMSGPELAAITPDGWRRVVTEAGGSPVRGLSDHEYADLLAERVARRFPTDALLARLGPAAPEATRLRALNPDVDLLARDLSYDSATVAALSTDGMTTEERDRALATLRAGQRTLRLADTVAGAQRLYDAGLHSSAQVVQLSPEELAERAQLDADAAVAMHRRASRMVETLTGPLGSILELTAGGFDGMAASNLPPDLADQLRQLPGYSELFGNQAYCDCAHCQSILGPAAYFVDLMAFVDEKVTRRFFLGRPADHPLRLFTRRPDLWTTPLTCANTDGVVAVLDIVNEVLENYLARATGYTGDLADRAAVTRAVYHNLLPGSLVSTRQPFLLPAARADAYLAHLKTTLVEVADVVGAPSTTRAAAALRMAWPQFEIAATPDQDLGRLGTMYGLPLPPGADPGTIAPIDATSLADAVGVARELLGQLVESRFVSGAGNGLRIVPEKSTQDTVQYDVERVHGLTPDALDHLHRFTRLTRSVPWTPGELDLVLTQLGITLGSLEEIVAVTGVLETQRRLDVDVEEVCALTAGLPTLPVDERPSMFARLFNPAPFVDRDGPYPKPAERFVHPALRDPGADPAADSGRERLLGALGVTDETLLALLRELAGALGADLDATVEADRGFALTVENLSTLYRHARVARLLQLSVADLVRLIRLTPAVANGWLAAAGDLPTLLAAHAAWRATGFGLDDMAVIGGGTPVDPSAYPAAGEIVDGVLADLATEQALTFTDTVFTFVPDVTETGSRRILAANPTRLVPDATPGRYRLAYDFDPTAALTIPTDALPGGPTPIAPEPAVRRLLTDYHPSRVLPQRLAGPLGIPAAAVTELLALRGVDLTDDAYARALHATTAPAPLVALVESLVPLVVLFRAPAWDEAALTFVREHPGLFGLADLDAIGLTAATAVADYVSLVDTGAITRYTGRPAEFTAADVRAVLQDFDAMSFSYAGADQAVLARVLGTEPGLLATLHPVAVLAETAPTALARLRAAVAYTRRLGVGGDTLAQLLSSDYDELERAADGLLGAMRAQCPEPDWAQRIGPVEESVRAQQRDALVDHLLGGGFPQFVTDRDLYEYFLLDVSAGGCATTSRVVAATNSVQLYVQRTRMNLEQDRRDPDDPLRLAIPPDAIDARDWSWRRSYRLWEANRKVFLWPENYLEPDLRDDKTPLFAELESTLLQKPIDDQAVLDAYGAYLAGIEELAGLQLAGAYHDKAPTGDVLHLFGATRTEPPVFYHRIVDNAYDGVRPGGEPTVWHPWRKVDVQVGARRVAPVVHDGRLHVFWNEYATKSQNKVVDGNSTFDRYLHTTTVKYATLRLDGRWTAPQRISLFGTAPFVGDGIVDDVVALPLMSSKYAEHAGDDVVHNDGPVESYTLGGFHWERPYPMVTGGGTLLLTLFGFQVTRAIDLFGRALVGAPVNYPGPAGRPLIILPAPGGERQLHRTTGAVSYAGATQLLDRARLHAPLPPDWTRLDRLENDADRTHPLVLLAYPGFEIITRVDPVNGSPEDCFLTSRGNDLLYLQRAPDRPDKPNNVLRRASTTLGPTLSRTLFTRGVDGLLALSRQETLEEPTSPASIVDDVEDLVHTDGLDFDGAFGTYFREIFLHVPFLIANHLNAEQRYSAAQAWYHHLFDPTAVDEPRPDLDPAERAQRARDRIWRYLELRGLDVPTLRDILTKPAAIAAYERDPFNPFAIARLRPTALQKSLVWKYVDNLLDWADSLFAQFTRESVNEALMLYSMAADILGPRPAALGSCGETLDVPRTYEYIAPLMAAGSQFLGELETWVIGRTGGAGGPVPIAQPLVAGPAIPGGGERTTAPIPVDVALGRPVAGGAPVALADPATAVDLDVPAATSDPYGDGLSRADDWRRMVIAHWDDSGRGDAVHRAPGLGDRPGHDFGHSLVRQLTPVFCVPRNPLLLRHWERVEDRLYKIRHCLDIDGVPRQLALFAPEIDPMMLVRAAAAGLSLDDVLGATSGAVPPYRFTYLVERARAHATAVQTFGNALLTALEKKDVEELTRLRATQEQHLLELSTRSKQWDIDAAVAAVARLERQLTAAEYRRDHYRQLGRDGYLPAEIVYSVSQTTASTLLMGASVLNTIAGIAYLVPQLGSPFAMKYGGQELGNSSNTWASVSRDAAGIADAVAATAKMKGEFDRRAEDWQFQAEVADHETKALDRELAAARLQQRIAERAMELHERTLEQNAEVLDFYGTKFSSLGLYTQLAGALQRLHRDAYGNAYAMARLAEQAYLFERRDAEPLLAPSYWEAGRAGLLAGDRLLADLDGLERRFVETDHRRLEIDQSFSLAQTAPLALVALRERGTCDFSVPEYLLDVFYPGHYRRRIRSVRLTIPAVAGPYVNVGATLSLRRSWLRVKPEPGTDPRVRPEVPLQRSVSVATSHARQDGGVFELNFRDERYLPFEGAGAVSDWRLTLPGSIRPFDYRSISDVIVHIAYDAEADEAYRATVEDGNRQLVGSLRQRLSTTPLGWVVSLRQDFPSELHRLLHSPPGSPVQITIGPEHLPLLLRSLTLTVTAARLALVPAPGANLTAARVRLNDTPLPAWDAQQPVGGLPGVDAKTAAGTAVYARHTLSFEPPAAADPPITDATVHDVLLYIEFTGG